MDALIQALARTEWLVGFAVGGIVVVLAIVVGISTDYLVAGKTHRALLAAETRRAEKAEQDADDDHDDQNTRFTEQMRQVSEAHKAEMERLLKFAESLQREVESWRQAYHVEAAGNDAEESARWDRIDAALGVLQRFVTEVQRHAPRALDAGHDGPGGSDVR